MSSDLRRAVKDLVQVLTEPNKSKTSAFDTQAEVVRIEGNTAWVHIPGGIDETPVQLTINAKEGDTVQVRVGGGKAWLVGNSSSPPTDDTKAIEADSKASSAVENANQAKMAAGQAEEAAARASEAADEAQRTAESVEGIARHAEEVAEGVEAIAQQASTDAGIAKSAADNAMKGLGQVEDVVGTLNWITDHSKVTIDTTPKAGKSYYIKNQDNTFTLVTDVEGKNPAQEGWYELTEAVQNYILSHLALTSTGLYVMADNSHWKVRIADDGVYIIDDTNGQNKTMAKYKDAITLGNDDGTESYQRLDYRSLKLIDKEGDKYFHVSDLRDASGKLEIIETHYGDDTKVRFNLSFPATGTEYSVKINGVEETDVTKETTRVIFTTAPSVGDVITFTYDTSSNKTKALTFGRRKSGPIGGLSTACGENVLASGTASHAEGDDTTAIGYASHAEGAATTTMGYGSHAEGLYVKAIGDASHAEGEGTIASGANSHAEGLLAEARGYASHASGEGTIAGEVCQTVVGKYNNNKTNTLFEVGKGNSSARSNAFEVYTDGSISINEKIVKDFIVEASNKDGWTYRKWNSGKVEAWYNYSGSAGTFPVWVSPIRYKDVTVSIPSGIFSASPKIFPVSRSNQFWVVHASPSSATSFNVRLATVASSSLTPSFRVYATSY